jgi:hypothetical protein
MTIGLWQVPLIAGAGIVLVAYLLPLVGVRQRDRDPKPAQQESWPVAVVRTVVLVVVSIVLLVLVWISVQLMDTSTLSRIAAIAPLILEAASLWLAFHAYQAVKRAPKVHSPAPAGKEPAAGSPG